MPVNCETPAVTSRSTSRSIGSVFEDAHRDRACVCSFIGVSAHVYLWASRPIQSNSRKEYFFTIDAALLL